MTATHEGRAHEAGESVDGEEALNGQEEEEEDSRAGSLSLPPMPPLVGAQSRLATTVFLCAVC